MICFDHPCDTVLLPCNHREICSDCLLMWTIQPTPNLVNINCPFCRSQINSFKTTDTTIDAVIELPINEVDIFILAVDHIFHNPSLQLIYPRSLTCVIEKLEGMFLILKEEYKEDADRLQYVVSLQQYVTDFYPRIRLLITPRMVSFVPKVVQFIEDNYI